MTAKSIESQFKRLERLHGKVIKENRKMNSMPLLTIKFFVLTLLPTGHIQFPTAFPPHGKAALRLQATELLRHMAADPLNPVDATTWAAALTGRGRDSLFQPAKKRKLVEVETEQQD